MLYLKLFKEYLAKSYFPWISVSFCRVFKMFSSTNRLNSKSHRRVNILWIDDKIEKFTYDISDIALNKFQIFCCSDVSDFFKIIDNYFIDVCVIDLNLNQMDRGEDLIEYVNNHHRLSKIVIYTASFTGEDDFKFDEFGNIKLSISARDFVRPNSSPRKLLRAIEKQLKVSESERSSKVSRQPNPQNLATYFPPSWAVLTKISDFSLKRILPAILILNFVVRITPVLDPELKILHSIFENISMMLSFCCFIAVFILHAFLCNKEIKKNPAYEVFMGRNISLYENDKEFSKSVNNKLEKIGISYVTRGSFDILKLFYDEMIFENRVGRMFTVSFFVMACLAFLVSLVISAIEVLKLAGS